MTKLPETTRQRWARLHRRIVAAGRMPSRTLEGCEQQVAMLDSGELPPLPPRSPEVQRAMDGDLRRWTNRAASQRSAEDDETQTMAAEYRESRRNQRRELENTAGPESLRFTDPESHEET